MGSTAAADFTTPLAGMMPPLTVSVATARIKNLHTAAFAKAKRLLPPAMSSSVALGIGANRFRASPTKSGGTDGGNTSSGSGSGDAVVVLDDGSDVGARGPVGSPPATGVSTISAAGAATLTDAGDGSAAHDEKDSREADYASALTARAAAALLKSAVATMSAENKAALKTIVDKERERVEAREARAAAAAAGVGGGGEKQSWNGGGRHGSAKKRPAPTVFGHDDKSAVEVLDLSHLPDRPRPGPEAVRATAEPFPAVGTQQAEGSPAKKLKVRVWVLQLSWRVGVYGPVWSGVAVGFLTLAKCSALPSGVPSPACVRSRPKQANGTCILLSMFLPIHVIGLLVLYQYARPLLHVPLRSFAPFPSRSQ